MSFMVRHYEPSIRMDYSELALAKELLEGSMEKGHAVCTECAIRGMWLLLDTVQKQRFNTAEQLMEALKAGIRDMQREEE